jgi:hypothetical protein
MDAGPSIIENEKTKTSNIVSNDGDVLQSVRVRRDTNNVNEFNRFLLRSQFSFVLPCGILLWVIFLIFG